MGMFNTAVVTAKGQALLTKTLAGTCKVVFTRIALSDAQLTGDLSSLTELTQIRQSEPVYQLSVKNDTTVSCEVAFTNEKLQTGYYVRAIGLYAKDPDEGEILYSISTADESVASADWMPPFIGKGVISYIVDVVTTVANSSDVEVKVDPSAFVTIGEFTDHVSAVNSEIKDLKENLEDTNTHIYKIVDLTQCVKVTEGMAEITQDSIDPQDWEGTIKGVINVTGYCEIEVENTNIDLVILVINGTRYIHHPSGEHNTKISFKGEVLEPITFEIDEWAVAKFTKFITASDYEIYSRVLEVEKNKANKLYVEEELLQIKKEQATVSNIKNSGGIGSLRQVPKTEAWTPSNQKIIEFFNANKEKYSDFFDENGNVVVKEGAFGDWATALSGYGHAGAQHSVVNNRRVIILPEAIGSHGEGNEILIASIYGHGEGSYNIIGEKAEKSHIEGYGNVTYALVSHVGGQYNTVHEGADFADVGGAGHTVSAYNSFVRGQAHNVSGRVNTVFGWKNRVSGNYQTVFGKKNVDDPTKAVIVGGGNENQADDVARKNIYTLDWSGNGWFAGSVEGTSLILKSSTAGSNKRFKITVDDSGTIKATEIK